MSLQTATKAATIPSETNHAEMAKSNTVASSEPSPQQQQKQPPPKSTSSSNSLDHFMKVVYAPVLNSSNAQVPNSIEVTVNKCRKLLQDLAQRKISTEIIGKYINELEPLLLTIATDFITMLAEQDGTMSSSQYAVYLEWVNLVETFAFYRYTLVSSRGLLQQLLQNKENILLTILQNDENLDNLMEQMPDVFKAPSDKTQFNENSSVERDLAEWIQEPNASFDNLYTNTEMAIELKLFLDTRVFNSKFSLIMFTGPPGTGKTTFANAMAAKWGATFFVLNIAQLASATIGETERKLNNLFQYVTHNKNRKFIIFLDEIDTVVNKNQNIPQYIVNVAITLQTAFEGTFQMGNNVIVIGATNFKATIREPILDRTHSFYYFDVPSSESILLTLRYFTGLHIVDSVIIQNANDKYKTVIEKAQNLLPNTCTYRNLRSFYENAKTFLLLDYNIAKDGTIPELYVVMTNHELIDITTQYRRGNVATNIPTYNVEDNLDFKVVTEKLEAGMVVKLKLEHLINYQQHQYRIIYFRPSYEHFKLALRQINFLSSEQYEQFKKLNKT